MAREFQTVPPPASPPPLFDQTVAAIVTDGDEFLGIIASIDLLRYLRRWLQ